MPLHIEPVPDISTAPDLPERPPLSAVISSPTMTSFPLYPFPLNAFLMFSTISGLLAPAVPTTIISQGLSPPSSPSKKLNMLRIASLRLPDAMFFTFKGPVLKFLFSLLSISQGELRLSKNLTSRLVLLPPPSIPTMYLIIWAPFLSCNLTHNDRVVSSCCHWCVVTSSV